MGNVLSQWDNSPQAEESDSTSEYDSRGEDNSSQCETSDRMTDTDEDEDEIPQSQKLNDSQCTNNAGGCVWAVDDMVRLQRFLCLGSEGGSYYTKEVDLTRQNAQCIDRWVEFLDFNGRVS